MRWGLILLTFNTWNHISGAETAGRISNSVIAEAENQNPERKQENHKLVRYSFPIAFIYSELVSCVLPVLICGVKYQNPWPFRAESGSPWHFFLANGHF